MDGISTSFGTVMLFQITIGILLNVLLLVFYIRALCVSPGFSSLDLIFSHLTLANTMNLLTLGIPETLSAWGWRNFLSDVGCKFLMYGSRVGRGLAICAICLLSVFQAVAVGPGTPRLARLKAGLPRGVVLSCLLSWGLSLLVDLSMASHVTGPRNGSSVKLVLDLRYCVKVSVGTETTLLIAVVFSFRDLFFVGLMSLASGYMVFVLYRHHRRVRHLHGPGRSPGEMPEVRAAKRVVVLVAVYGLFYVRQTIMLSIILNMKEKSPLLVNCHMVLAFTFPVVCPFLIIQSDRRISAICQRGKFSVLS
ncbi:vomeronasal 1 receptor ornAnaV1R3019 isoform X1 [Ornithorhynchus anatinus]|uniref:vomeronasal 1 receptor ornAnaV1R3019 isoform X1 n=1 Tax=Ornithorhynchus anatinus TaxID=9258 RepID=UPI0010A8A44F|nr:vomeronasal 1 receptor ornAnaV1R3019 isoform X1 [Ornithorhynchus anatinus]